MPLRSSQNEPQVKYREQENMSIKETGLVIEFFLDLVNQSRRLESIKMDLAILPDFNIMDSFSIFDT